MKHPGRRTSRIARSLGGAALVAALSFWPAGAVARSGEAPATTPDALAATPGVAAPMGGVQPSIHYEDALAHAADDIDFTPGGRVAVGFTPRPDDDFQVDGASPQALPAGQVSGREMSDADQGSVWTADPPDGVVDGAPGANAGIDGPIAGPTSFTMRAATAGFKPADPAADASPLAAVVSANGLRREVFGFLPYWEVSDSSTTLDWSVLSTVAYFSVGADASGNLMKQDPDGSVTTGWGGWTSAKMTSVINDAHQHGARVVLTISCFAWTTGQEATQAALLGSDTARANLAAQVAAAVRDRGADGVNLDFEPIVSGYADEFTALVRSVRAQLDAITPGYQLTFDTTGYIGNYPIEDATAPGGADAIFIMGYDYRGSSASSAGSISPLSGPVYDLTDTINAYSARVSPSKLILGVPYYGRAWSTPTADLHAANISGTQYGTSVTAVYSTAADLAATNGRRFDAVEQTPWTAYQRETCSTTYGCVTAWRQLYYDDADSLKLRYDLVNGAGLRGVGIWALGYDGTRPELYAALAEKFLKQPFAGVFRQSGTDRYSTAAAISAAAFAPGVPVVYIATGIDFPDALAGAAAAGHVGAPLLLVSRDTVPPSTAAELARLQPGRVVILGGPGVVGDGVAGTLSYYTTGGVFRQSGTDRYSTAAAISAAAFAPGVPVVYIATGIDFPDALAGAAAAGHVGAPLLLVSRDTVPPSTAAELARLQPGRVVILGGPGVVGDGVAGTLSYYTTGGVFRQSGTDRYSTAAAISAAAFAPGVPVVYIATGIDFPDALAGAAAAGHVGAPLLLVSRDTVPPSTAAELARLQPGRVVMLGGPGVLSDSIVGVLGIVAGG